MEQKHKQKRSTYGVGNKIKVTSNMGSVTKIESRREAYDEEKKVSKNYSTNVSFML